MVEFDLLGIDRYSRWPHPWAESKEGERPSEEVAPVHEVGELLLTDDLNTLGADRATQIQTAEQLFEQLRQQVHALEAALPTLDSATVRWHLTVLYRRARRVEQLALGADGELCYFRLHLCAHQARLAFGEALGIEPEPPLHPEYDRFDSWQELERAILARVAAQHPLS